MGKAKSGPKRKRGDRYACGKLRVVVDRGNERRQEIDSRYAPFRSGKAGQWISESAIGRAWAVGLLDGHGVDAAAIRDAGLNYAALHKSYNFNETSGVANYSGEDRRGRYSAAGTSGGEQIGDGRGALFLKLDGMLLDAGSASYDAVRALTTDYAARPWENPPWLDRLINREMLKRGLPLSEGYCVLPHCDGRDDRLLQLAIEGLLTIASGRRRVA